jgi:hypothetical protein
LAAIAAITMQSERPIVIVHVAIVRMIWTLFGATAATPDDQFRSDHHAAVHSGCRSALSCGAARIIQKN